jgi:hypothetical protein
MRRVILYCEDCKNSFTTEPYFSEAVITKLSQASENEIYIAHTRADAICPSCGERISQILESDIYRGDILDLAIRKYKRD